MQRTAHWTLYNYSRIKGDYILYGVPISYYTEIK